MWSCMYTAELQVSVLHHNLSSRWGEEVGAVLYIVEIYTIKNVCCSVYMSLFSLIVFLYFHEKSWVWDNQKLGQQKPPTNKQNRHRGVWLKVLTYGHVAIRAYLLKHTKKWHYDICMALSRSSLLPFLLFIPSWYSFPPMSNISGSNAFCEANASCLVEANAFRRSISCELVLSFRSVDLLWFIAYDKKEEPDASCNLSFFERVLPA